MCTASNGIVDTASSSSAFMPELEEVRLTADASRT